MPQGVYAFLALDNTGDGLIDTVVPGPWYVSELTSDPPVGELVLTEQFGIADEVGGTAIFTSFFTGPGSAGEDSITGPLAPGTSGERLLLTDTEVFVNDPLPSGVSETVVICFLAGTSIATPGGETPVEALEIGDLIVTYRGDPEPVKWVGYQTISTCFGMADRLRPVRVRAGALGNGLPHTDLVVTADHGMVLDGYVINASALVNGSSIDWVPMSELSDSFTVYHVETEAHDVILANGAPSETYIDHVARQAFDNYPEYVALYGKDRTISELPFPRISSARMVPVKIQRRLGIGAAVDVAQAV